jgi:hypothetical protein
MGNVLRAAVLFVCAPIALVAQATLVVPTGYPTIQAAIAAAAPSDSVSVLPGVYVERIDFLGKAITVRSAAGAATTVIDGSQGGPVVRFATGEGPASVLEGFTIRNGRGLASGFPAGSQDGEGGGVHCANASPTIRGCVIRANSGGAGLPQSLLTPAGRGGPGGVLAIGSSVRLHDCVITANLGGAGGDGAPLSVGAWAVANAGGAGGVLLLGGTGAAPELLRCRIDGNTGGDGGGATNVGGPAFGGDGGTGGLELRPLGLAYVVGCSITGNVGGDGGSGIGTGGSTTGNGGRGGFRFTGAGPSAAYQVHCCAVVGNRGGDGSTPGAGGSGGGTADNALSVDLSSSTIAGNVAGAPAGSPGGLDVFAVPMGELRNCIVWGNTPTDLRVTTFAVERCNVGTSSGTVVGTGNVSVDPLFVNLAANDVHLTAASPCRHAGGPTFDPPFDVDGDPRIVGPAIDLGADEWDGLTGTREDIALELRVNGAFAPAVVGSLAGAGDVVAVRVWSPSGTLANTFAVVGLEPWLPPNAPVGPLPAIHLGGGAIVLGTFAGVGANGTTFGTAMPGGLAGLALRVQAFALTASTANGQFAATAARDVLLQ